MSHDTDSVHVVDWTVENFSVLMPNKERLYSKVFQAGVLMDTSWRAYMYPHGYKDDKSWVTVGLERASSDDGPEKIELKCELFLIAADSSEKACTTFFTGSIKNGERSLRQMVKRDFLLGNRWKYLPCDMLTVRFKITYQLEVQYTQIVATTEVRSEIMHFEWTIDDLSSSCKYDFNFCKVFDKPVNMELLFDPATQAADEENKKETKIVVQVVDNGLSFHVWGRIAVLDSKDVPRLSKEGEHLFLENEERKWTISNSLDLDKLREKKDEFLLEDKLRLKCVFLFFDREQDTKMGEREMLVGSVKRDLNYDMEAMNKCGWYPDVKLRTDDGHTLPAHRWLLASRCPTFLRMFEKSALDNVLGQSGNDADMEIISVDKMTTSATKEVGIVKVSDVDRHTLSRLIHFLYTDKCSKMDFDDCLRLFSASVSFHVVSLKLECLDFLKKNFNSKNVYDALVLADKTGESQLRLAAQNFIAMRSDVILLTDEWQEFVEKAPSLAKIVMCDLRVRHQEKCNETFVM